MHEQIKIYFSRISSVVPRAFLDIPVYITTMHLSGTEESSPSCHRLPHKHYVSYISYSFTVHITESARFWILMAVSSLYSKH